jgi:type VI secretion system protein ImpC
MSDFAELLARPPEPILPERFASALTTLAEHASNTPHLAALPARRTIEAICAEIDRKLSEQINQILHHPEFQRLEASWRGLFFMVNGLEPGCGVKIRLIDIGKRELARTLRKFRGTAWDQSPLFRKIYEEEYGQLGGEPFGLLVGDYAFDHRPEDVQLLSDIAMIAAAAHAPFVAAADPAIMQMERFTELANPRDLTRIFQTPEYAAWRALRTSEDSRYLALCLPRFLARLPYGARTDPVDAFAFEEDAESNDVSTYCWANPAFAFGANVARAFAQYGWCTRIRGIDGGGAVDGLPMLRFPTADGAVDLCGTTEVALSERREAELARSGFVPLLQRKNEEMAAFVSAQSLQTAQRYEDPAATANAIMSAQLPYLFACCRFAHFLKCMVRDKIGSSMSRFQLEDWLDDWLQSYIDSSPGTSSEEWKAAHPLQAAKVSVEEQDDKPGQYTARFMLQPHYQLEGLTVALRLVSRLPTKT